MKIKNQIIFGKDDRVRSGWRAIVFVIAFVFSGLLFFSAGFALLSVLGFDILPGTPPFLVANGVLSLIPALLVGWGCGKLFEGLPYRALGAAFTGPWFRNFLYGLALGGCTLGVSVAIAMIFGGMRFELNNSSGTKAVAVSLLSSFLVFAVASAFEESLFRGYILQTFARSGLAWLAIAITAVFFGAVHLGNPNAGLISTANTVLAGIWFGVAYLRTRDLWFVWGLHLMWNFAQGSVFGIEVSGMNDLVTAPVLKEIDSGPMWLTGTTYGIEGGIACTIAILASILAIKIVPTGKEESATEHTEATEIRSY
ncbi:MAG TPA: type II CAAX endopeptidase family protein [Pyrinomonadaceae bacterium]|nr:type II CAAX endopeptidase family protein [Pyrinomonadaceae bacterium]